MRGVCKLPMIDETYDASLIEKCCVDSSREAWWMLAKGERRHGL